MVTQPASKNTLRLSILAGLLGIASTANANVMINFSNVIVTSGVINGATYYNSEQQPTGSGVYDPFVRVGGANQNVVEGYNTTAAAGPTPVLDTDFTDTWNHEITVGQVGFLDTNSDGIGDVMRFFLDINQNSGNSTNASPLLSLDEVQVFISTNPNQSTQNFVGGLVDLASSALVYRMDGGTDGPNSYVKLDYDRNSGGSGIDDMTLELTKGMFDSAFTALGLTTDVAKNGAYIYLYSRFGENNDNNDGYEEWSRRTAGLPVNDGGGPPQQEVPEPGVLLLMGAGLMGLGLARRRKPV